MPTTSNRLVIFLICVFSLILAVTVLAGVGGVMLMDAVRSYASSEAHYSKAHKGAVIALHRYAETGDRAYFLEYENLIEVPESAGKAFEGLLDNSRPREESYQHLQQIGIHPDDAAAIAWLFRYFGETALFSSSMQDWKQSNQKVAELDKLAGALDRAIRQDSASEAELSDLLSRIYETGNQLTLLGEDFFETFAASARRLALLLSGGIAVFGGVLTLIALGFTVYANKRVKVSEALVRLREERLRDVAELSADWIWEKDADLRFSFMSQRVGQIVNRSVDFFIGRRRWDLGLDPGEDGWDHHIETMQRHENLEAFDYTFKDVTGQVRHFRVKGKPLFDENGVFTGYRGMGADITSEVVARREADYKNEMLETSFENLGQGICVVDDSCEIVFFNSTFKELLILPDHLVSIGGTFEGIIRYAAERGDFGDIDIEREISRRLASVSSQRVTVTECRPLGKSIIEIRGQPLPSGGFVRTYRDATAERSAQARLQESERRTREVIDRTLDAYVSMDSNENIIDWNPAAERIFGWTKEEAVNRNLANLIIPARYRPGHVQAINEHRNTGKGKLVGYRTEMSAQRKSGEEFPIEMAISTQQFGGEIQYNTFMRDITDRKEAEHSMQISKEAAEVANQAKTEFLAIMSHELRTPLNAIIGFSDIMARKLMGPLNDHYLDYAVDIRKSGAHLLELINDILDVSCLEANKAEIEATELNVSNVVHSCLNLISHTADARNVTLVNELPAALPELIADKRRVRQILLNLIGNAIKFSPVSASVFVRVDATAPGLAIEILDQGVGMASENVDQVFEPFVQLKSALNRSHEGAGLGLALAKRFAELHGGSITLESELGKGTLARVLFPEDRVLRASAAQL